MWWGILALFALAVWTLWFVVGIGPWLPIVAIAIIGFAAIAYLARERIGASKAAIALEKAIAQQGEMQAKDARPERRAEIAALQKQVQRSIDMLKKAQIGKRKHSSSAALYSLPWYMIIGPPGAGKSTALEKSGLINPSVTPSGSVRGIGGTRTGDGWFPHDPNTNDTAGS